MAFSDRLRELAGRVGVRLQAFGRVAPPIVPGVGLQAPIPIQPNPRAVQIVNSREALEGSVAVHAGPTLTRYSSYPATALDPTKIASIFSDADRGIVYRYGELCLQIPQRDGHLFAVDRSRRTAVTNKPFRVYAADEADDLSRSLSQFMTAVVDGIDNFNRGTYSLLSANAVGYSCAEIIWARGKIRFRGTDGRPVTIDGLFPRSLEWVHPKHFRFDYGSDEPYLDLGTDGWVPLPITKFLFHLANGEGIAATRGFIRPVTWLHMLKHRALTDWGVFLALFGIPNIWAKIPREKWEDPLFKSTIEQALRDFGQGLPAILLDDQDVTIQPAQAGGGSNDVHSKHVGFCNAEISKVVNGETLTTELSQTGSYNASATHQATLYDTVKADGDGIDSSYRGQLFRAVLLLNAEALARALGHSPEEILLANPKCEHVIDREVTPLERAQILDYGINKFGAKVGVSAFYRGFGFSPPAPGEDTLPGTPTPVTSGGAVVSAIDATEGVTNPKPEPQSPAQPAQP